MTRSGGYRVVLTADRTLMADYPVLFDGILATVQTDRTPGLVMRRLLAPPVRQEGGVARRAPLGLRRVEAALLASGFGRDEVVITAPEALEEVVGPETRLLGVSSGDPLGRGMTSTTMEELSGGQLWTRRWYAELMGRIARLRARGGSFRLVAGGPGAWQLEQDDQARARFGIDVVVSGYCEGEIGALARRVMEGAPAGGNFSCRSVSPQKVPPLRGATVMGAVEISRGCGRGCAYCTLAQERMIHLPPETILADVQTNLEAGASSVAAISEDIFRYGGDGAKVNPEAVISLFRRMRRLSGLRLIQLDHASVASVAQFSEGELRELHGVLTEKQRHRYLWVNLGVESASGKLLEDNRLTPKMQPIPGEEWEQVSELAVRRLSCAGFLPMVSLIFGLPGETPDDLEKTLAWVERLASTPAAIFPIFHAAIRPGEKSFTLADMTPTHWRLFRAAYALNFKWVPRLCWDNQTGAGASWRRRLLLQLLGCLNKRRWRAKFARQARGPRP